MTTHPTPTLPNTPPPFVVRVTALPTSALQVTRSPGTSAALGRAREHQDQLAHGTRQLDLALHRQVGEATDQEQRRLLLRLKRRTAEKAGVPRPCSDWGNSRPTWHPWPTGTPRTCGSITPCCAKGNGCSSVKRPRQPPPYAHGA